MKNIMYKKGVIIGVIMGTILCMTSVVWAQQSVSSTWQSGTSYHEVRISWTSDASGSVSYSLPSSLMSAISGSYIYSITSIPDSTNPPTEGFDITLLNSSAGSLDVLGGVGANMSSTSAKIALADPFSIINGQLIHTVQNAGNSKSGVTIYIFVK